MERKRLKGKEKGEVIAGISSSAVKAKTGKTWKDWLSILETAGAKKMTHPEIADYLYTKLKVPGWWAQMITVGYEQARGLRQKHQRPEGYEVSVSKTMAVSVALAFKAWKEARIRNKWLPNAPLAITKATLKKSIRFAWENGKTRGDVNFYSKGQEKSQVVVQHSKLPDAKVAKKMKEFWGRALERMKGMMEE